MKKKSIELQKLKLKEVNTEEDRQFKKICCPSCDQEVPADNININDKIAKCGSCDVVFPFHKELGSFNRRKKIKQEVLRPEGIDIFHYKGNMEIAVQQPLQAIEILPMVFCTIFAVLLTLISFKENIPIWLPMAFWIPSLYSFFNLYDRQNHHIHIHMDSQYFSVDWRPRKFHKDQIYSVHDIDQLYVKQLSQSNYHSVYMIVNSPKGQKHVKLISHLENRSKARYLEQEIEAQLGIEDREVPEENI